MSLCGVLLLSHALQSLHASPFDVYIGSASVYDTRVVKWHSINTLDMVICFAEIDWTKAYFRVYLDKLRNMNHRREVVSHAI